MPLTTCALLEEFEILCGDAGISKPTIFEKQALAQSTKYLKRDMIFETSPRDSLIPGALIPSLLVKRHTRKQSQGQRPVRIILLGEHLLEPARDFLNSLVIKPRPLYRSCKVIGINGNARDDRKELGKLPELLVSTPQRLIDHIRRDNLSLSGVTQLTILRTPGSEEETRSFDQDVLFIHSKLSRTASVHLFTPDVRDLEGFKELLRHPKVVVRGEWNVSDQELVVYLQKNPSETHLLDVLCSRSVTKVLILAENKSQKTLLENVLSSLTVKIDANICIIGEDHCEAEAGTSVIAFYDISARKFQEVIRPEAGLLHQVPVIITLCSQEQESNLQLIQENYGMKTTKRSFPDEQEVLSGKIKMLLEEVKQFKHPEKLAEIRRMMRKQVPFHLRSYLFAYLLRNSIVDTGDRSEESSSDRDDMKTIFVSIGKNRKVYPKDLARLFVETGGITDDDIGTIRVLDNYSFINVSPEAAQGIIDKLDNYKYRGRNITVNFAKKKTS